MTSATTSRQRGIAVLRALLLVIAVAIAAAIVYMIVIAQRVAKQAAVDETRPAPAIVVFGAAQYAGRPSPVFRARLDHAATLFGRKLAPLVITTGAGGGDTSYTEGGVGRDYLISQGVPDRDLIAETQSSDTARSAMRVATILRANGMHECLAVSDAYHMYRVKSMMAAQGITAYASPRPNSVPHSALGRATAAMREGLSYLVWRLGVT